MTMMSMRTTSRLLTDSGVWGSYCAIVGASLLERMVKVLDPPKASPQPRIYSFQDVLAHELCCSATRMNSVVPPAPHGVLPKACSRLCLPAISGVLGREGNQHMEVSCVGGVSALPPPLCALRHKGYNPGKCEFVGGTGQDPSGRY